MKPLKQLQEIQTTIRRLRRFRHSSNTSEDVKDEWVKLTVTFEWEAGDVIDSGDVAVSFQSREHQWRRHFR